MKRILIGCSLLVIGLVSCISLSNNPFDALIAQKIGLEKADSAIAPEAMNEPCDFPCFLGVRPGLTTKSELDTIIQTQSSLFQSCSEVEYPESRSTSVSCQFIEFSLDDLTVGGVFIDLGKKITVHDFLDFLGEPTRLWAWETTRPDQPRSPGLVNLCFAEALTVLSYQEEGEKYDIQPSDFPTVVYLNSLERYQYLCDRREGLQDWNGYGEYKVYRQ